jgi:transposase
MDLSPDTLPPLVFSNKIEELKEALLAERFARQTELTTAKAKASDDEALIARLRLMIAKLNRDRFGPRSERTSRLLDQLELQLEELEASATEDELTAEKATPKTTPETTQVTSFERKRPSRKPLPEHLPRERVVIPGPTSCACCGGTRLSKLGEDITETLEVIPRQWKVIQHVRERFSCRDCETIEQAPAPFHVTPRGWAGPNLLAMILFEKFGQHQPLNRQAERYTREGVELSLSTLADQVGACCSVLEPIFNRIEADAGSMFAMIDLLAEERRLRRCSITHGIGVVSIRKPISPTMPVSCKPMPIAAMASSTNQRENPAPSPRPCVGGIQGASSSNLLILRLPPVVGPRAKNQSPPRRWLLKPSVALTRYSPSSEILMALTPKNVWQPDKSEACPWWSILRPGCAKNEPNSPAMPTSPMPWITCLNAGAHLPASSKTEESA